MENDLISRSALKSFLCKCCNILHLEDPCEPGECNVMGWVSELPAVDAVEVVRCLNCKHWHSETGWCNHHSHFITDDGEACHPWESANWKTFEENDFCSYGERRGDDGK